MKAATEEAYKLLHNGSLTLARAEAQGIKVDEEYLSCAIEKTGQDIKRLEEELRDDEVFSRWRRHYGTKTNLNSENQLAHILFGELGYPCYEWTEGGQGGKGKRPKVTETALQRIGIDFTKNYIRKSKLEKAKSTFLEGIQKEVVNGRLHTVFNLHTVATFRSSSDSPNFQNFPVRDKEIGELIRRCFIADSDEHVIVENDISGAEVRAAACYHKDPVLIQYIKDPTKDMHRDMAAECYKLKTDQVTKQARYCGKNMFVFPEFYGSYFQQCAPNMWDAIAKMSLTTVDGVPLDEHLAAKGITELGACDPEQRPVPGTFEHHLKKVEERFWNERFKVYSAWKKKWYDQYLKRGWFQMLSGFVCQGVFNRNDVINYPVQGFAFHWLLWGIIQLDKELRRRKMRSRIAGQIHDSIIASVPLDELQEYLDLVQEIMTVRLLEHWDSIIVPVEIEAEVTPPGGSWFEKAEWTRSKTKWSAAA